MLLEEMAPAQSELVASVVPPIGEPGHDDSWIDSPTTKEEPLVS